MSNIPYLYQLDKNASVTANDLTAMAMAVAKASIPVPAPVAPYKVFTALLTQTGGFNGENMSGGSLVVGESYQIVDNLGSKGFDFTNVGAQNNDFGTWFIATGTTPNSWGTSGFEVQLFHDTGAPVATVLENTIGNVWFTYASAGNYSCQSNALFISNKSIIVLGNLNWDGGIGIIKCGFDDSSYSPIVTTDFLGTPEDNGILYLVPIEIRVYN